MCIAFWTLEHPDYALVLCTNRDEYLSRPTQEAHFHSSENGASEEEGGDILSGVDELGGGTWLGMNRRSGRVALLTNITEPYTNQPSTRGTMVSAFLDSASASADALWPAEIAKVVPEDTSFAGFNLLLLSPSSPTSSSASSSLAETLDPAPSVQFDGVLVTNHGAGGKPVARSLTSNERGCGCCSNGIDGQGHDTWPKYVHGSREFASVIATPHRNETALVESLFDVLSWESPDPVTERVHLRRTIHVSLLPITIERPGKAPVTTSYGTRLSTVILVRKNGEVVFVERDIWKTVDGEPRRMDREETKSQRAFEFTIGFSS